jgi:Tfp pilus assembly protein PilF
MARSISTTQLTPADELRRLLDDTEKRAVNIRGVGADRALELLHWLDEIDALIPELQAIGVNIQPELGRWQGVQGAVKRHSSSLQRELRPLGGLAKLRDEQDEPPPEDRCWWWLDVTGRRDSVERVRRTLLIITGIVVVLIAGVWLFQKLFPVDPAVQESYRLQTEAEQLTFDGGDPALILQKMEAAATLTPNDLDIQAWLVVLYEQQGQTDQAGAIRQQLLAAQPPSDVYTQLAQAYLQLGHYEQSLRAAEQAIAENPDDAAAYIAAGMAAAGVGDRVSAMSYLQEASDVAERTGNSELQAIARIQLAQLLQSPSFSAGSPTPAP